MKRNIKAEKKEMADQISLKLNWGHGTSIQKDLAKDLTKLRHFTLFALSTAILHKTKPGSRN